MSIKVILLNDIKIVLSSFYDFYKPAIDPILIIVYPPLSKYSKFWGSSKNDDKWRICG